MNFQEKFNYAILKKINQNDIEIFNIDNGSIKKAIVSFIFEHHNHKYFYCLSYTRQHKCRKNYFDYNPNDLVEITLYKTPDDFESKQNIKDYQFIDSSVIPRLAAITEFEKEHSWFIKLLHYFKI